MTAYQAGKYKAYSVATGTVAKTRQVVMIYDNAIKYLRQAEQAINETRIEDRYTLLKKTTDIMIGLQSSIDFDQGGDVAVTLHQFYTSMLMRISGINFTRDAQEACQQCQTIVDEIKQMRTVWDAIDRNVNNGEAIAERNTDKADTNAKLPSEGITISA